MVTSGNDLSTKGLAATLVSQWPQAFDIENDIFIPGKADIFRMELASALMTRGLYTYLASRPVTKADLQLANPHAADEQIEEALQLQVLERQRQMAMVAANLPRTVKGLSLSEQRDVASWVSKGDGLSLYVWIMSVTDVSRR